MNLGSDLLLNDKRKRWVSVISLLCKKRAVKTHRQVPRKP